uniref:EB domain-containing protein n=1 Tax=Ditylenchus dipsaci TaxID=166011 RepID=A0A915E7I9_9BILA
MDQGLKKRIEGFGVGVKCSYSQECGLNLTCVEGECRCMEVDKDDERLQVPQCQLFQWRAVFWGSVCSTGGWCACPHISMAIVHGVCVKQDKTAGDLSGIKATEWHETSPKIGNCVMYNQKSIETSSFALPTTASTGGLGVTKSPAPIRNPSIAATHSHNQEHCVCPGFTCLDAKCLQICPPYTSLVADMLAPQSPVPTKKYAQEVRYAKTKSERASSYDLSSFFFYSKFFGLFGKKADFSAVKFFSSTNRRRSPSLSVVTIIEVEYVKTDVDGEEFVYMENRALSSLHLRSISSLPAEIYSEEIFHDSQSHLFYANTASVKMEVKRRTIQASKSRINRLSRVASAPDLNSTVGGGSSGRDEFRKSQDRSLMSRDRSSVSRIYTPMPDLFATRTLQRCEMMN